MTALRQKMIEDMRIRDFAPTTIEQYVRRVSQLARYYGKSPDQLGPEEIRAYQVHLTEKRVHWGTLQSTTSALQVAAMVQSRMLCRYGCGLWALLKQRLENWTDAGSSRQPALRLGRNCTGIGVFQTRVQARMGLGGPQKADFGPEGLEV